jgi:hypothetical protein
VAKALRILGFADDQLRDIRVDAQYRMDIDHLAAAIAEDETRGQHPLAVVANAGSTNTGAIDPLPQVASVCRRKGLWLHVDGAYGGGAVVSPSRRSLLDGIELANGFHELADAGEQRRRFDRDNELRRQQGLEPMPADEHLLAALQAGLPDCAGVALGIDRLLAIAGGVRSLDDVMAFPVETA